MATELIFGGVLADLEPEEAVALLSALVFQASGPAAAAAAAAVAAATTAALLPLLVVALKSFMPSARATTHRLPLERNAGEE